MKQLVLFSSLALVLNIAVAQEKEGSFAEGFKMMTDSVGAGVKEGWDVSKDKVEELSHDAKEGFDKARDNVKEKLDRMQKTYEVSDAASLKEYLTVTIPEAKAVDNNLFVVTMILNNETDKPVKFADVMEKTDILALSKDNIAHFATAESFKANKALIVPSKAAIKVQWTFKDADSQPVTLRFFNVNYPLPQ